MLRLTGSRGSTGSVMFMCRAEDVAIRQTTEQISVKMQLQRHIDSLKAASPTKLPTLAHSFCQACRNRNTKCFISSAVPLSATGGQKSQTTPSTHLLTTVPDDGQIEELASVLLRQDRVNACSMWAGQLLIYCQIICWWSKKKKGVSVYKAWERNLSNISWHEAYVCLTIQIQEEYRDVGLHSWRWDPMRRWIWSLGKERERWGNEGNEVNVTCAWRSFFIFLPVCRSSRDATARCRYQHSISLFCQPNPLLHQPSLTLDVLLWLFWICKREEKDLNCNSTDILQRQNRLKKSLGLTMFVDDLLDLFVEVLPTFDQGLRPPLSNTVEIFFLEADRSRISAS